MRRMRRQARCVVAGLKEDIDGNLCLACYGILGGSDWHAESDCALVGLGIQAKVRIEGFVRLWTRNRSLLLKGLPIGQRDDRARWSSGHLSN